MTRRFIDHPHASPGSKASRAQMPPQRQPANVSRRSRVAVLVASLAVAVMTSSCSPVAHNTPAAASTSPPDTSSVLVDSVNYMHERSTMYTLYDLGQHPPLAVGGAIVDRLATGGEKGCCLNLPRIWRPGIKVRLTWHESDRDRSYPDMTADLEVPHYQEPADLYVVFHPRSEVELVVSAAEPGHPGWQGRNRQTPWEKCVSENGRKVCKAVLPKLFHTESSRGACTYMKETNVPDAHNLCDFAVGECMRDYEDEAFCTTLLWDTRRR